MSTESGSPRITELIEFLKSKGLSGNDIAEVVMMVNGGDPQNMGQDDPPSFRGQPLTGGMPAQDAALRKRITDANARNLRLVDEHRESLGLKKIRNLG